MFFLKLEREQMSNALVCNENTVKMYLIKRTFLNTILY